MCTAQGTPQSIRHAITLVEYGQCVDRINLVSETRQVTPYHAGDGPVSHIVTEERRLGLIVFDETKGLVRYRPNLGRQGWVSNCRMRQTR
jgi:hypothetical protein